MHLFISVAVLLRPWDVLFIKKESRSFNKEPEEMKKKMFSCKFLKKGTWHFFVWQKQMFCTEFQQFLW